MGKLEHYDESADGMIDKPGKNSVIRISGLFKHFSLLIQIKDNLG